MMMMMTMTMIERRTEYRERGLDVSSSHSFRLNERRGEGRGLSGRRRLQLTMRAEEIQSIYNLNMMCRDL